MASESSTRGAWSLRRQFLVPLSLTILGVGVFVSLFTAWTANESHRRSTRERFENVHAQIRSANYPLTTSVVQQIQKFSEVEVLLLAAEREVALSSLSGTDLQSVQASLLATNPPRDRLVLGNRTFDCAYYPWTPEANSHSLHGIWLLLERRDGVVPRAAIWAPVTSGLVSALAIALVTSWVVSNLVRRIELLEGQVQRIADGNYDVFEPVGPRDSIHRLSCMLNSLSQQLSTAHAWVAKTERSRLVTMIAGGMAHQLRNSLTGISLLLDGYVRSRASPPPEEIQRAQQQVKTAAESVRRLLASDPGVELADEPDMAVASVCCAVADSVAPYAEHHRVRVVWDGCEVPALITGEPGTGKSIVAAMIHRFSHRSDQPCLFSRPDSRRASESEAELFGSRLVLGAIPEHRAATSSLQPGLLTLASELPAQGLEEATRVWLAAEWPPSAPLLASTSEGTGFLYDQCLGIVERALIEELLKRAQGNRAAVAQHLGLHRTTLRQKMKRYGLDGSTEREASS